MNVTTWYIILTAAICVIAVMERFIVYTVLVRVKQWLPEKAGSIANISTALSIGVGLAALGANALLVGH